MKLWDVVALPDHGFRRIDVDTDGGVAVGIVDALGVARRIRQVSSQCAFVTITDDDLREMVREGRDAEFWRAFFSLEAGPDKQVGWFMRLPMFLSGRTAVFVDGAEVGTA